MSVESLETKLEQIGAREILDAIADGAYITDPERRIVFWNRAAQRITGWPAQEVVNHCCGDNILVHVDKDGHQLCGREQCPLHRAIVTGQPSEGSLLLFAQHRQGHRIPLEVSVAPLRDQAGRTVGGIEVFRDLTSLMENLQRAKAIQAHALECPLPDDPRVVFEVRYIPEELVGGDFYRVEAISSDSYAVLLADVMGHGVASALYTMQLRSFWEECRADLPFPSRFMTELNRRLHRLAGPDGYFATAIFLLFDAASGKLRWVRAGHPSPLLLRRDGLIDRLDHLSPALGLHPEATYAETEAQLEPGDTALLFTDGAIELVDKQGSDLGEAGLVRLLGGFTSSGLDLGQVEGKLLEYCNLIRLPDDLTLLSLHRSAS
ncbi:PAS:Stage II sporulation E [Verrucomicrobia bacterium]|nr:PAS:Stage II sporulation E [Verrucomicrobiota bacterium]